jgi:hypothetical protein
VIDSHAFEPADADLLSTLRKICDAVHGGPCGDVNGCMKDTLESRQYRRSWLRSTCRSWGGREQEVCEDKQVHGNRANGDSGEDVVRLGEQADASLGRVSGGVATDAEAHPAPLRPSRPSSLDRAPRGHPAGLRLPRFSSFSPFLRCELALVPQCPGAQPLARSAGSWCDDSNIL